MQVALETKITEGEYKDIQEAMGLYTGIEIYKPNMEMTKQPKDWFNKVFGNKRNMINCSFYFS